MKTNVLDRVESLQQEEESSRVKEWLELVHAYVDGDLPDAKEVARIFREHGKSRADLERDGKLFREYRGLEADLARVPALQAQYDDWSQQLSDAIKGREAAEQALRAAQEKLSDINARHSIASRSLQHARDAAIKLRDARFNPVLTGQSPEVQQLTEAIRTKEASLEDIRAKLVKQRQALAGLREQLDVPPSPDLPAEEKGTAATRLFGNIEWAEREIERQQDRETALKRELAELRRDLSGATT